jgi:hypothetical protein
LVEIIHAAWFETVYLQTDRDRESCDATEIKIKDLPRTSLEHKRCTILLDEME